MLPNFLVIGAPRSGTTWIDKNLREHPDVYMPKHKELHFFDVHYERGLPYYESFFADWKQQRAVGEATPDYIHGQYTTRDIPRLIKQHLPDVKLIASLRNPVDRAYSRFWNSKAKYEQNIGLSFEEKLRQKPEFIREGFYGAQLQRFFELFPRERILVLLYDDMIEDPRGFMRRMYQFLDVDPDFVSGCESHRVNAAAGKKYLARSQTMWLASRALSRIRLRSLAERVRKANATPLPQMNPGTRRMLHDIYAGEIRQLQELIGRDLSRWNRLDDA
jgi:hypothetical protein